MSKRFYCDVCEIELPEPYCLYTIGWTLCDSCLRTFREENTTGNALKIPKPPIRGYSYLFCDPDVMYHSYPADE